MATDPSSTHQGARLPTRKSRWTLTSLTFSTLILDLMDIRKILSSLKPRKLLVILPKYLTNSQMRAIFSDRKRISMSLISQKRLLVLNGLSGPNKLNAHMTTNLSLIAVIDLKAQVRISDLSPNILYYPLTLYHFLVYHLKNFYDHEHPEHAGDKDHSNSHYLSLDHEHNSATEGLRASPPIFITF